MDQLRYKVESLNDIHYNKTNPMYPGRVILWITVRRADVFQADELT